MSASIPSSTLEKFTTFGDLLRFLRRRAGITQMELSIAVGYSDGQISRLEQGLRLPDIPSIEARFVPALDLEDEPKAVSRLLELAANVRREDAPGLGLCPYKGLNCFDETDAELFVGREALTAKLVDCVLSLAANGETGRERFLAVVGASGSGKSSLLRAGLVPALRWNPAAASWPIHLFTPTAHPLESMAASLTHSADSVAHTAALMDDLARDPRSLALFVRRALKSSGAGYLLLIVDQFEELFTLCRSEQERNTFIDNLLLAASHAGGPVITVIVLRADFYAHCASHPRLREALARQQEYIGTMGVEELRRAIEEPARRGRWELEPGLVDVLLHDVGHEPGALPLLSHALLETWQRRRGRTMTLSGYASSGGVRGAIAETAEAIFTDRFTYEQQAIARRILLRLTELGDETSTGDTRRRAAFGELILKPEEAEATKSVLKVLADARLIITSEDSAEVAHEALIREWPKLRGWLEDNREGLRLHRHLTEAANEWAALNPDVDGLYRGARLVQAREWAAAHADEMNALECEFLDASVAWAEHEAAERELQRQRELEAIQRLAESERQRAEVESQRADEQARAARQLRSRAQYLAAALVMAVAMAFVAIFFGIQARQSALAAQSQQRVAFSRQLAAAAVSNLDIDPERSILLAMQAVSVTNATDRTWTAEADDALRRSLKASRLQLTLRGHTARVWGVGFSPDGKRLATSGSDGTARVWDAASGETLLVLATGNTHGFSDLAFNPLGTRLATAGSVGTARIWDAISGKELLTLGGHTDWVSGVAFSPVGTRLATASEDRSVKIWDAVTGQEQQTLLGHAGEVWGVTFSPDGKQVATASGDGTVKIWDAATGREQLTLARKASPFTSVAFSPDGTHLAAGSLDRTVKIWKIATGEQLLILRGHMSGVAALAFSPDGARLATAGQDGTAKLWDAATGQVLFTLSGHQDQVLSVAFSPDCVRTPGAPPELCGSRLVTGSWDGTAKVWNASFSRELLTLYFHNAAAGVLSPDGSRLAAGDADGSVNVWDLSTPLKKASLDRALVDAAEEPLTLNGHDGAVNSVAFSPDGTRLASASEDRTVKIWDLATRRQLLSLGDYRAGVHSVAFSPGGTLLATASSDDTLKIWDLKTGRTLVTLNYTASIAAVDFSPDGTRLAAGTTGGTVIVWETATGRELLNLAGHAEGVYGIAFSPDGLRLATVSDDATAKVWDADSGDELFTLVGHTGWVNGVAFSPDSARLATAGQDGTARVWDVATGQPVLILREPVDVLAGVAFSPDGTLLTTMGADGTVRYYGLRIEDLMALARRRVTRTLTAGECRQYVGLLQGECIEEDRPAPSAPAEAAASAAPAPTRFPQTASAEKGNVCEVTDQAGVNDQFFNQIAYQGVQRSAGMVGWDYAVKEPHNPAGYRQSILESVQSGCDLIVLPTAFSLMDVARAAIQANPNQKFQVMDATFDPPFDNVWQQVYAVDQAAFLAGYLAAATTKTGKVGTFGGTAIPPVTYFMDGFARGVAHYNEKNAARIEVLGWDVTSQDGLFTGNFNSVEDGRRMGEKLLSEGADILMPVAGSAGLGTAAAVKAHGNAYIIGVDSDWSVTFPEYAGIILTSIEKRMDGSVLSAVRSIVDGTFTGGIHVGTLENGGVGIAPYHNLETLVSPQVKADLEQITADIVAGKIKTLAVP